ncbi:hypothetical protein KSP40_PGU007419 [Platanthera guangdongensis]|uniref:Uncharacterized protein n=1 Tax=Platanthera guangdongensis TaxID=2320717 RepID=A0ABR2LIF9_9ASPA
MGASRATWSILALGLGRATSFIMASDHVVDLLCFLQICQHLMACCLKIGSSHVLLEPSSISQANPADFSGHWDPCRYLGLLLLTSDCYQGSFVLVLFYNVIGNAVVCGVSLWIKMTIFLHLYEILVSFLRRVTSTMAVKKNNYDSSALRVLFIYKRLFLLSFMSQWLFE